MKGDLVILRSYGDKPLIRRIFEETEKVVFVTDDSLENLISLGFPRRDVFQYAPKLALNMERLFRCKKWNWKKLKPY